ncbi:shikimate kinase [Microbacterium sp. NRRL B-14842]|uniref:shikimate kinase n=1 Tax=Microbacterium sp. NRRL B-14842 TaxID=3162881 RepID=UPI003D29823E
MAAGKTSVGRRVARRLGVAFIDTDKRIVAAHGPIPEIFATHGEGALPGARARGGP